MSDLFDLTHLVPGATGQRVRSRAEKLTELKRQKAQLNWQDATPLARDAATAYREVMNGRRQRDGRSQLPNGRAPY